MIQSKLFRASQLNAEKKTYLHDCKPIICDKNLIISYWESLSLHEKEKIFMVYDLNIIDELVEILNIARTRIASTEFERKSGQIIKMPEKTILLEYLYFDALEIYFNEEYQIKKFIKSLCLIFNKVTNDVYQKYLEDQNIPQCTDSSLIQAKKKVLKFKIKSLISILDFLDLAVDQFCNGEKVIIKKRHYSTLYQQLLKNPLPKNPSSDEIRQKIREITELLSVMLENNLIKAYKKATKYYSKPKKESYKNQSSSSSAKMSLIIQHQPTVSSNQPNSQNEKSKTEGNKENNSNINISENQTAKEELLQNKKIQQQVISNRNLQENNNNAEKEDKVDVVEQAIIEQQLEVVESITQHDQQNKQQSITQIQNSLDQATQETDQSIQPENTTSQNSKQQEETKQELQKESENQMKDINQRNENEKNNLDEIIISNINEKIIEENQNLDNNKEIIIEKKVENVNIFDTEEKKIQAYQNISQAEILNRQKNEIMMEIENQNNYQFDYEEDKYSYSSNKKNRRAFQEDGFYNNSDDNHFGSISSSPQFAKYSQDDMDQDNSDLNKSSKKKRNIKKYLSSEVEPISKKLCIVNLNSLIIRLDNNDSDEQSSIFDSDEEYYEPDEKENFHYNQELKDYDIVDVLGDNFKFDPKFCFSKQKIDQLLLQSQQQQQQFFTHSTMIPNIQIPQQQPLITSSGKKQLNANYDYQKNIYSDDSNDESSSYENFNNKGKYYGHGNQNKGKQQLQQNYSMQDQMHQMMNNFPFQMHNNQYSQLPLFFLINQNMMNPQQQMSQTNKFKGSNKHLRNSNNNNNYNNSASINNQGNNNNHVIHTNPNNIVNSNRKNNQQNNDYHSNQLINNSTSSSQNTNNGQYLYSNKNLRNNNNNNNNNNSNISGNNQQSHNNGQGYRNKKRYNPKGNNQ